MFVLVHENGLDDLPEEVGGLLPGEDLDGQGRGHVVGQLPVNGGNGSRHAENQHERNGRREFPEKKIINQKINFKYSDCTFFLTLNLARGLAQAEKGSFQSPPE